MPDLVPVRRALLSVSDKTGLIDFARALVEEFGVELLSTGGTAGALREAGLPVTDVASVTGFPEMLDGRVKTLHPHVHAGILADREKPEHMEQLRQHGIAPIDLVCVNLYPFEQTIARPGVSYEEAIENIDIGGPTMVRAAAKNHAEVLVVTEPTDYADALKEYRENGGACRLRHRQIAASHAFDLTSRYDDAIHAYMAEHWAELSMETWHGNQIVSSAMLRYGENPHQQAYLLRYAKPPEATAAHAVQLHGKQLGYINLLDADTALSAVKEFDVPACCIVKHATPCGVASGDSPTAAFERAYAGDPLAAFGGIVAFNSPVDVATAEVITAIDKLLEVIVAPQYDAAALTLLKERWKNVRILETGPMFEYDERRQMHRVGGPDYGTPEDATTSSHLIVGGALSQQRDLVGVVESEWKVVSNRQPSAAEVAAMKFNWLVCKHVKSNAVVIGGEHGTYGIGGGQVDRVAAAEHAVKKAAGRAVGAVAASDAFFPFPDGPKVLLDAGVTAIVQPGGSVKDQLTIDLANERGAAMIFTGRRHFRH